MVHASRNAPVVDARTTIGGTMRPSRLQRRTLGQEPRDNPAGRVVAPAPQPTCIAVCACEARPSTLLGARTLGGLELTGLILKKVHALQGDSGVRDVVLGPNDDATPEQHWAASGQVRKRLVYAQAQETPRATGKRNV